MLLDEFGERVCFFAAVEFVVFGIVEGADANFSGSFRFSDKGAEEDIGERIEPTFLGDHAGVDDAGIHGDDALFACA